MVKSAVAVSTWGAISSARPLSTSDLLSTQSSLTNIAVHRFSCCVPTVWNSLPSVVRTADSFTNFRSQFKTYMFTRHL